MAAAGKLAVLVEELEPGLAAVHQGVFAQRAGGHQTAVFVQMHLDGDRLALVADVGANQHLGIVKLLAGGMEPDVLFLQRTADDHIVHDPAQIVGVLPALVAQGGKAIVFTQQQAAVGGNAVQAAGVLADDVPLPQPLVQAVAVIGLFAQGEGRAHHHIGGLGGDDLLAVQHAVVGDALIVPRHVVGGGLDAGAGTEGRQDAPGVVTFEIAVVVPLPQTGDVAVGGDLFGLGAILVQHGAGHAHGSEHPILEELLQRDARRLIHHVREDGVALVGIAHVVARLAQGGIAPLGDIVHDLLDLVHLVGGGGLHGAGPVRLLALDGVQRDRPLQRLHGRDAGGVGGQMMQGDALTRGALQREIGEVFDDGIAEGAFSLGGQNAQRQGGGGFAHGGDAHNGVFVHRATLFVGHTVAFFKDDALGAADAHRDTGQLFFRNALCQRGVQCLKIVCHNVLLSPSPCRLR